MEDTLIIFNPAAKGEKAARFLNEIQKLSVGAEIKLTSFAGEAEEIARVAVVSGYKTVVAAGGDGTINEVLNGIGESSVNLGILPVGTMNVLAAELGLPMRNLPACWKIISDGHVINVDLPRANDRYFVQLAGVGLDAQVVRETDRGFRKNFGPLSYVVSLAQIASRKPPELEIHTPDGAVRHGCFVIIGNGRYYGGPFRVFSEAAMDDGLLDVLVFKDIGYLDLVRYTQSMLFGGISKLSGVDYFQTPSLRVISGQEVPVELDGEVAFEVPVDFGIAPTKLRLCTAEKAAT
ncbi:MAG TPA: diacylglycerol kinase family protein [Chthoniobacterales bacterium]|jgi:YegS/Rv2252/BmrU family lipid kinase